MTIQEKNTIKYIEEIAHDLSQATFQGSSFDISLLFENNRIRFIRLQKQQLYKFIRKSYIDKYKKIKKNS